jgi:UDP-N-acetyl-D-glucosamine dehydrogenase
MSTATQPSVSTLEQFKSKVDARTAKIGVVGLGYVGLPLVLLFSEQKFAITGFDIDNFKVDSLNTGKSYIVRITPDEINGARGSGFKATTEYAKIADMDAVIICVPTPLNEYREPDMSYIVSTAEAIAPYVHPGQIVILESTTYPGTTEDVLIPILEKGNKHGLKVARGENFSDKDFFVAFSPEREDPGNTEVARHDIPKVVGGVNQTATDMARAVYGTIFRRTVPVSTPAAAEMTKLLENIYRCVNIAMVNELKLLCLRMGVDIWEVIEAAKTKPFGFHAFYPGPGLGGHCIPVDPYYLSWKAREYDFYTRFIELAGDVNSGMPYHVVTAVGKALNNHKKSLNGSKVLVLGVAYKKDIDDLRESPSLTIIEKLKDEGVDVFYNDPFFPKVGKGRHYDLQMTNTPLENLGQYDCVLIVTDHTEYDYKKIVNEAQLVVDSRNATKGIKSPKIVLC